LLLGSSGGTEVLQELLEEVARNMRGSSGKDKGGSSSSGSGKVGGHSPAAAAAAWLEQVCVSVGWLVEEAQAVKEKLEKRLRRRQQQQQRCVLLAAGSAAAAVATADVGPGSIKGATRATGVGDIPNISDKSAATTATAPAATTAPPPPAVAADQHDARALTRVQDKLSSLQQLQGSRAYLQALDDWLIWAYTTAKSACESSTASKHVLVIAWLRSLAVAGGEVEAAAAAGRGGGGREGREAGERVEQVLASLDLHQFEKQQQQQGITEGDKEAASMPPKAHSLVTLLSTCLSVVKSRGKSAGKCSSPSAGQRAVAELKAGLQVWGPGRRPLSEAIYPGAS
jgi:hypothetical protein